MNQKITKGTIMFAWITEEELEWLMMLHEFEERAEEFEIESIGEGLNKFRENMNNEDTRVCDRALRGLREEGMIQMDARDIAGELSDIKVVEITQRGRKLIDEAKCIFEEKKEEPASADLKLREMEKKEKRKEEGIDILKDVCASTASFVLEKIFRG